MTVKFKGVNREAKKIDGGYELVGPRVTYFATPNVINPTRFIVLNTRWACIGFLKLVDGQLIETE